MVQITSAMSIAKMVGANRVVLGHGVVHVTGDAKLARGKKKRCAASWCKSTRRAAISESRSSIP